MKSITHILVAAYIAISHVYSKYAIRIISVNLLSGLYSCVGSRAKEIVNDVQLSCTCIM